ncbi:MAG: terminase family protein [Chloroflexota bacterium]|nr:terminase family protein [Chloroflexota bacterium]
MLARDLAIALDPALTLHAQGLAPDPWQAQVLRSDAQQSLLLCTRQAGKSTCTAALATYTACYVPESLILLLSPSLRQSQELFLKVMQTYVALGKPVPSKDASALRLTLINGSRIVALPGSEETIRGFSGVRLLIIDEASRVDDALYYSVRPMLAVSGGRLVALTTPFGKRGFFHQEWIEGGPAWQRVKVTAYDCPRISPAFLEQERAALGDRWFNQEYLCEFSDTIDQVFAYEHVMAALDANVRPLFGGG